MTKEQNVVRLADHKKPARRRAERTKLTQKRVADAKPTEKRQRIADAEVVGLHLVIQPSGAKSFVVRGRIGGGRSRPVIDVTLGAADQMTLSEARAAAKDTLAAMRLGEDPRAAQQEEISVKAVIDAYTAYHEGRGTATVDKISRCLRRVSRRVGAQPFDSISARQWSDAVVRTYTTSGLAPAQDDAKWLRSMTKWALKRGLVTVRLAADIEGPTPSSAELAQAEKRKANRWTLRQEDWPAFWDATAATKNPIYKNLLRLLALTGLRRREASLARWRDIDFDGGTWKIPPENAKSARAHTVFLGPLSTEILQDLPGGAPGQFVFPSRVGGPISGWSGLARPVAKALGHPLHLHGLRRGVRTALAEFRVDRDIAEMMLSHAVPGLEARYNLAGLEAERREAQARLEAAWAEALI